MQGAQKLRSEAHLQVSLNDEVEAQRSRWTFYETIKAYRIPEGNANHLNPFLPAITKMGAANFFFPVQKNPKDIFLDTENLLDRLKKRLKSGN
jgi:hypothetical protein